ncbi:MBL fold metallo-hydrolase [Rhizobium deserti]|uniref:MBL fold metallo-hydrolase n=1 Tax=Rhizobium deserti TaxID=2547961 RepID=A0A4R5UAW8_9HYPH|nr:MBL fold metallo-hydrolase [Rhizobium deserti]TDK31834.1 MBL fold metallo-hydrolase [Rhizobium deserti]
MSTLQVPKLTRRGFCMCCVGIASAGVAGGWLSPREAYAEAHQLVGMIRGAAAKADITTYKLRGNVAVLEGSGGNIAVFAGKHGKVMIDAGITATQPKIEQALADLGRQPVTHLVNTHWHFDHADGNEWIHAAGAKIIAHENTKKRLMQTQRVEDWDYSFPPSPAGAIPSETFATDQHVDFEGCKLHLICYEPAHTDSDIGVHFVEQNILHTGDTYWNGIYPFIDYSTGGSIDGKIAACAKSLSMVDDKTIVIPGHGAPVSNKAELKAFHDMMVSVRDNVAALKAKGMSVGEVVAAGPTAAFDKFWGKFVITPGLFTELVYEGV